MTIKSALVKFVSWFRSEDEDVIAKVEKIFDEIKAQEKAMPDTVAGATLAVDKVAAAIQIALALSAIDPTLTTAAVQAGTVAALSALYPVAAA